MRLTLKYISCFFYDITKFNGGEELKCKKKKFWQKLTYFKYK